MLRCSIHNIENYGSVTKRLPDLDELLASSFDPDISDSEEGVRGQENTDSLRLDLRALSLLASFVGYQW